MLCTRKHKDIWVCNYNYTSRSIHYVYPWMHMYGLAHTNTFMRGHIQLHMCITLDCISHKPASRHKEPGVYAFVRVCACMCLHTHAHPDGYMYQKRMRDVNACAHAQWCVGLAGCNAADVVRRACECICLGARKRGLWPSNTDTHV